MFKITKTNFAVIRLIVVSLLLVFGSGAIAYNLYVSKEAEKGKKVGLTEFLHGGNKTPKMKAVFVGMVSGLIFGFIDNAGLWFGMDALEPYLPSGKLTQAGWGNTYSDALGSFLATFIGYWVVVKTGVENTPIWAESLGIILGCILGIFVPRVLTGKN